MMSSHDIQVLQNNLKFIQGLKKENCLAVFMFFVIGQFQQILKDRHRAVSLRISNKETACLIIDCKTCSLGICIKS